MALFYPHYSSYLDFLCCSFSGSGPRDSRSIASKAADSEPWASWSRMSRMRLHNIAGWWWPTPLKNMKVRWDHYSQYMENTIHVPNHQPVIHLLCSKVHHTPTLCWCSILGSLFRAARNEAGASCRTVVYWIGTPGFNNFQVGKFFDQPGFIRAVLSCSQTFARWFVLSFEHCSKTLIMEFIQFDRLCLL